ncbi:hypothetical protein G7K_2602-t1 [Saitoella complicata NRRL Y-17804]|uniref:Amine oxidase domain-containing protein n=1 Tax=Saitoella complicata (strain BCRC 22490 / CBS 7301 / JCM 7358 / NBRC 10748 / NRRL Y-17804) TaxID=698492 RepID=A0A0E9NF18_SAICN|nr:hypothetical protein G7K_2602-t1 [Saitoella complicata NRRL Y-17804]
MAGSPRPPPAWDHKFKQTRIAIIGTGLAGLTTAHLLSRSSRSSNYSIHLFEAGPKIGFDAHSLVVDGRVVDVPMRAVTSGYYPRLMGLYRSLGVKLRRVRFSYSFSDGNGVRLTYGGGSGRRGVRASSIWETLITSLTFIYFAILATLYTYLLPPSMALSTTTLDTFLQTHHFPTSFSRNYLFPLFSAICTCSHSTTLRLPASEVLRYAAASLWGKHCVVEGGVRVVRRRLMEGIEEGNVHLGRGVERIRRANEKVKIKLEGCDDEEEFDHVVFAVGAAQARRILSSSSSSTKQDADTDNDAHEHKHGDLVRLLDAFESEKVEVITHRDTTILPASPTHLRTLNLSSHSSTNQTSTTHILAPTLLQTTNPTPTHTHTIPSPLLLGRAQFYRGIQTLESLEAVRELEGVQGWDGVWFVGSWTRKGLVLLEGCVEGAEGVVQGILAQENARRDGGKA